jgi:hypothetical protein
MLLYHFTTLWALGHKDVPGKGTIWRDGILPGTPEQSGKEGIGGRLFLRQPLNCVWLTEEEFPLWYEEDEKPAVPEIRITVRLPTVDKRLIRYERWMWEHLSREVGERLATGMDTAPGCLAGLWRWWWCYFGTIPRQCIKGEHLAGAFDPNPVRRAAFIEQHRNCIT